MRGRAGARAASPGGVAGAAAVGVRTGGAPAGGPAGAASQSAWETAPCGLSLMMSVRPRRSGCQSRATGVRGGPRGTGAAVRRALVKGVEQPNQGAVLVATRFRMMLGRRATATLRGQFQNVLLQPPALQQCTIAGRQLGYLGRVSSPSLYLGSREVLLSCSDRRADGGDALSP